MIISRTPLRMSFVGGGSDLPSFYRKFPGAVVSTTVNRYVYVTVNPKFDEKIRVSYSRTEEVASVDEIRHPLVREALKMTGVMGGVEMTSIADIPSRGSGLGSSSSFTVGALHALHAHCGRYASAEKLASQACEIELERCGEPIGKQDQFAAAFGGLNFIQFNPDDSVSVEPIVCQHETVAKIQASLVVFYTGVVRRASAVLRKQRLSLQADSKKRQSILHMVKLAHQLRVELQNNNPEALGQIIHENWLLKRGLCSSISSAQIDDWYACARRAGAVGGKLLGAGAGGFLLFVAPPERHDAITHELKELRRIRFEFEPLGSRIIFIHEPRGESRHELTTVDIGGRNHDS